MKLNNKKGFTLIEMIIVITIFSILMAAVYILFDHLTQTYYKAEKKWLIEREVSETMQQLVDVMDVSLSASLSIDETDMLDEEGTIVVYYDESEKAVMVRDAESSEPYALNDAENFPLELSFTNVKKLDNGDGTFTEEKRDKVIFVTLKSLDPDISYTLETAVYLQNMKNDEIKIPEIRTGVYQQPPYYAVSFKVANPDEVGMGGATKINFTGCFIATAAYGDYDDNMVMLLRRFRDQCLLTNPVGEKFVEFYYNVSPPIADFIRDSNLLKNIVKILLLPLVGIALFLLHPAPISAIILLLIGLVILIKILLKKRKKLADI